MLKLIEGYSRLAILRLVPKIELRRAKLESLAREFLPSTSGSPEERIHEAFKLGRVWLRELETEEAK